MVAVASEVTSEPTSREASEDSEESDELEEDEDEEEDDEDDEDEEEESEEEEADESLEAIDPSAIRSRRTRGVKVDYTSAEALAKAGFTTKDIEGDDEDDEDVAMKDD